MAGIIGRYNWLRNKHRKIKDLDEIELKTGRSSSSSESSKSEIERDITQYVQDLSETVKAPGEEVSEDGFTIRKITRFFKFGKPVMAQMAVNCLKHCNFGNPITLDAMIEDNLISIMINFLQSDYEKLQLASLQCLAELAKIQTIGFQIVYFQGLNAIIQLLWAPNLEVRCAAALAIKKIATFQEAWKIIRKLGGIPLLVNLLFVPENVLQHVGPLNYGQKLFIDSAVASAVALKIICADNKNKIQVWKSGTIVACENILKFHHTPLLIAILDLLGYCATTKLFRTGLREMGLISNFKCQWFGENRDLTQVAAEIVFMCARDVLSREIFGKKGIVKTICDIISTQANCNDKELMSSLSGALWKCSKSTPNLKRIAHTSIIPKLLTLMDSPYNEVRVHVIGCIHRCFHYAPGLRQLLQLDGLSAIANQMHTTDTNLIINLSRSLGEAAIIKDCMEIMVQLDTITPMLSYLRTNNPMILSIVGWSLCPLLENMEDPPSYVRSLIGGIEPIMDMLASSFTRVSTPACAIVAILCKYDEILEVFTEYGIVPILIKQARTRCNRLRYHLSLAVAACCGLEKNVLEFQKHGIVTCLIEFLRSKSPQVRNAACRALFKFSGFLSVCVSIYECKFTIPIFFNVMSSDDDEDAQISAAGILQKIRLFSLYRENILSSYLFQDIIDPNDPIV